MRVKTISFLFTVCIFVLVNCTSHEKEKKAEAALSNNHCRQYPSIVDSLHLQSLYDSANWAILTWQCDKLYRPKDDTSVNKTLGELPLQFDSLFFKADTVIFLFKYMDKNKQVSSYTLRDYTELITGVAYSTLTNRKVYLSSLNGFTWHTNNPQSRYTNSMQPELIDYIKKNRNKIDACFREEARRRKIID